MTDTPMTAAIPPIVIEALRAAQHLVVLTGAGMSAESGVPTFRDAQTGLWARFQPQDLATPEAFQRQPARVWRWYAWRRELVARARPHAGHQALVEMARRVPGFTLITQNVDGMHQAAGSTGVIELHGNINRTRCSLENTIVEEWTDDTVPPRCPRCGGLLRPDVVWFHEMLPEAPLGAARQAIAGADLLLVVGTSAVVEPAASLPHLRPRGSLLVEVNPEPTSLAADAVLAGPAGRLLPALVRAAWPEAAPVADA